MAKRGNNEGSIFKRPDGTWRAQISINGKRTGFSAKTQAECRRWIRESKNQISEGFNPITKKPTLQVFLDQWLDTIGSALRPSTVKNYYWVLKNHVNPYLGKFKITDIKPEDIQKMYATNLGSGASEYMVNKSHKVLHVAFEHALKLYLVHRNPVDGTTPPKPKSKEMAYLDEDQVQTLLLTAQEIRSPIYTLCFLAINSGMRQGELLGLKWRDLDWQRKTLNIHRQLAYLSGGEFEFSEPKTKSGKRSILLSDRALHELRNQLEILDVRRNIKRDTWEEYDLVFPSAVGTPLIASNLRRSFRKLLAVAGLPKIRFHDLRHTAASLMLNYGIPVLIVSRRLGHAKASITLDVYGHLIPSQQEEAVKIMDDIMTPVSLPVAPGLHQFKKK